MLYCFFLDLTTSLGLRDWTHKQPEHRWDSTDPPSAATTACGKPTCKTSHTRQPLLEAGLTPFSNCPRMARTWLTSDRCPNFCHHFRIRTRRRKPHPTQRENAPSPMTRRPTSISPSHSFLWQQPWVRAWQPSLSFPLQSSPCPSSRWVPAKGKGWRLLPCAGSSASIAFACSHLGAVHW